MKKIWRRKFYSPHAVQRVALINNINFSWIHFAWQSFFLVYFEDLSRKSAPLKINIFYAAKNFVSAWFVKHVDAVQRVKKLILIGSILRDKVFLRSISGPCHVKWFQLKLIFFTQRKILTRCYAAVAYKFPLRKKNSFCIFTRWDFLRYRATRCTLKFHRIKNN